MIKFFNSAANDDLKLVVKNNLQTMVVEVSCKNNVADFYPVPRLIIEV
jgi:hypothetical protein